MDLNRVGQWYHLGAYLIENKIKDAKYHYRLIIALPDRLIAAQNPLFGEYNLPELVMAGTE